MKKIISIILVGVLCSFCGCKSEKGKVNYSVNGEYVSYNLVSDIDLFGNVEMFNNTHTIWHFEEDEKDKNKGTCGFDSAFEGSVVLPYSIINNEIFWENSLTKEKEKYLLYKEYIVHSETTLKNESLKKENEKLNGVCSYSSNYGTTIKLTFYHSGKIDVLHTFEDGYRMYKGEYELNENIIILNLWKVNNNQVEEMDINTYLYFDDGTIYYYLFKKQ